MTRGSRPEASPPDCGGAGVGSGGLKDGAGQRWGVVPSEASCFPSFRLVVPSLGVNQSRFFSDIFLREKRSKLLETLAILEATSV